MLNRKIEEWKERRELDLEARAEREMDRVKENNEEMLEELEETRKLLDEEFLEAYQAGDDEQATALQDAVLSVESDIEMLRLEIAQAKTYNVLAKTDKLRAKNLDGMLAATKIMGKQGKGRESTVDIQLKAKELEKRQKELRYNAKKSGEAIRNVFKKSTKTVIDEKKREEMTKRAQALIAARESEKMQDTEADARAVQLQRKLDERMKP